MANSTQSNVSYSSEIFKQYLMQIATGIVWKDNRRAIENESSDINDLYRAELFVVANRGLLNFDIVKSFPRSVLLNSAIPQSLVDVYATDKRAIPVQFRKAVVKEYEKALTSVNPETGRPGYYNNITGKYEIIYEEKNNYYRMLMGLPDIADTDYVYNTDQRWDTQTPIHDLPYVSRIEMENEGIIDELIKKNPDKLYLKFIGKRYVSPFNSRIADRFEILYNEESSSPLLNSDFIKAYNNARQLVLSVYYTNAFNNTNNLYDNFLAMCILFITIQVMMSKYMEVDMTRDFYDTESLKLVYDSYSVPFFDDIPLEYHRKIVKNMNKLISYKGSAKVFFDLFNIFDSGIMDIYSYFLLKIHDIDETGTPRFNLKYDDEGNILYDEEGRPLLDESNYKLKFSQVKIYDDPALSVSDESNNISYNTITESDPYWIEDEELIKKLANESFNYLESKYIGIQTVFDLMKIAFESAYIFRIITDNKELTDRMIFRWSDIGIECSLYHAFIYLAAIYCRYFGYEGIIADKIPAIMETLGYDFDKALEIIKARTSDNSFIKNNKELMTLLINTKITNIISVNGVYENVCKIRDLIIEGYTNAKTIDEFYAYRDLYKTLMVSKEITEVYTDKNGDIYNSFTDILSEESPELMQRYLLLEDNELEDEMVIVIDQLESLITSLKYLSLASGMSVSSLIEPLFKILKFFKSAKAELVDYDVIYNITMRGLNFIKLMDLLKSAMTQTNVDDIYYLVDILKLISEIISHKNDCLIIYEKLKNPYNKTMISDYIRQLTDRIHLILEIVEFIFKDSQIYNDLIENCYTSTKIASRLLLDEKISLVGLDILESKYNGLIRDKIYKLADRFVIKTEEPIIANIMDYLDLIDRLKNIMINIGKHQYSSNNLYYDTYIERFTNSSLDMLYLIDRLEDLSSNSVRSNLVNYDIIKKVFLEYSKTDDNLFVDILNKLTFIMKIRTDLSNRDVIMDTSVQIPMSGSIDITNVHVLKHLNFFLNFKESDNIFDLFRFLTDKVSDYNCEMMHDFLYECTDDGQMSIVI